MMNIPAELDGDWWFLIEDEPLDPESSVWMFNGETVIDSRYPDAPGRQSMKGDVLTIVFPSRSPTESPLIATVAPPPYPESAAADRPVDPNFMSGYFNLTIDGYEHGSVFRLLRDGPWLDDIKRKSAEERATGAAAGEPRDGGSVEF